MRHPGLLFALACLASFECRGLIVPEREPPGGVVTKDARDALDPTRGDVALVFDLLDDLETVRFSGPGAWVGDLTLPKIGRGISAVVLRLPPGNYCFESLQVGRVRYSSKARDGEGLCFKSIAGELNYPGHLVVRGSGGREGTIAFDFRPAEFLRRMMVERPEVLADRTKVFASSIIGGTWSAPPPGVFAMAAYDIGETALGDRLLAPALESGSTSLLIELGMRYSEGNGLPQDQDRAVEMFERAAALGAARGATLACFARVQELLGSEEPPPEVAAKTATSCRRGAESGDARSQFAYAELNRLGVGTPKDPAAAFRWALAAADQGSPEGQYAAGHALRAGDGVPRDLERGRLWLERAAEQSQPHALTELAEILLLGDGVPADPARAVALLETAASINHGPAVAALALALAGGRGVPRDLARAETLLAEAGRRHPEVMFATAWLLVTHPDPAHRDGSRARRLAQQALVEVRPPRPGDRAVVAATLADVGDFKGAQREIARAIDDGTKVRADDPRLPAWRAQQATYAKGMAWREP